MPNPEISELFRWYELEEALDRFTDPELARKIELAVPRRENLAKTKAMEVCEVKWSSKAMNAPPRITPDQRSFIRADSELGKLLVERRREFHDKLLAGELFASAKRRITDDNRVFVESDAWRYLRISQDGRALAEDNSETLYSLRFRNVAPFLFGDVESKLAEIEHKDLKARDRAAVFALKLYPNGRIERTLTASQARIKAAMTQAGLRPVCDNTITAALERLGFYRSKPNRKKS